jgi:1-acyl-sn-glycerol-3-phosphate acyltransferase
MSRQAPRRPAGGHETANDFFRLQDLDRMTKTLFEYDALSRMLSVCAAWLFRVAGWRIEGAPPKAPKFVVAAAPHTTNWDFLVMLGVVLIVRLPIHWLGKHTIFRPPFGAIFSRLGGIPIDRGKSANVVEQLVQVFAAHERFALTISPEGSRRQVGRWKSGFYHIAKGATVPLYLVSVHYPRRTVTIGSPFHPSDDPTADAQHITAFFATARGKFLQEPGVIELSNS